MAWGLELERGPAIRQQKLLFLALEQVTISLGSHNLFEIN